MTELRTAQRTLNIVEVWDGDTLIAAIYPSPGGVKIVSKYLENRPDLVTVDAVEPLALTVRIR